MPHFMIVLIPDINLLKLSWMINCPFLRNMEPLNWLNKYYTKKVNSHGKREILTAMYKLHHEHTLMMNIKYNDQSNRSICSDNTTDEIFIVVVAFFKSLRKHAYSNILKFSHQKVKIFR